MSFLDMTLDSLIVKPYSWGFGQYRVPLHWYSSPFWPEIVSPDRVLSGGNKTISHLNCVQAKWLMLKWIVRNRTVWLFNWVKTNNWCLIELLLIHKNTWNHFTVRKRMSLGSFKNIINKMCLQIIYISIYIKRIWH